MSAAKITSKGQITIPQDVRKQMGVSEGDRVEFVPMDDGSFVLKPKTGSVTALKGMIPLRRKPATLEEMDEAIAAEASKFFTAHRRLKGRAKKK